MDARDAALYRSAWADEIDLDLPPLGGLPLSGRLRADDYTADAIALVSEFKATQHVSTNHLIAVEGDRGSCICYTHATHYLPVEQGEPWLTVGVRYDLSARRLYHVSVIRTCKAPPPSGEGLGWGLTSSTDPADRPHPRPLP